MKLYLAGPMTGLKDFNFPAFDVAAAQLRAAGYEVFSPAEFERSKGFDPTKDKSRSHDECMADDLPHVCRSQGLALLPNWHESDGARIEVGVAQGLHKPCETLAWWLEHSLIWPFE